MKKIITVLALGCFATTGFSQAITGAGTGSGPTGYVPRFNSTSNIINSSIHLNGVNVGIGTTGATSALQILTGATNGGIRVDQNSPTSASALNLSNIGAGGRNWSVWSTGTGNVGGIGNFVINDNTAAKVRLLINSSGGVLIGDPAAVTMPIGYNLYVQNGILTEKVKVALTTSPTDWADYVFDKNYKLKTLDEVNVYIKENKHLPGVPSTQELRDQGGIDLGKMDAKLMEKIEELTLYTIQLNEENKKLAERISKLESSK